MKKSNEIAKINDQFRSSFDPNLGKVFLTSGVNDLEEDNRRAIIQLVKDQKVAEDDGNNPYGENDYGSFTVYDEKIMWKIDYYNDELTALSSDPASVEKTVRVLTIMLASEY